MSKIPSDNLTRVEPKMAEIKGALRPDRGLRLMSYSYFSFCPFALNSLLALDVSLQVHTEMRRSLAVNYKFQTGRSELAGHVLTSIDHGAVSNQRRPLGSCCRHKMTLPEGVLNSFDQVLT